MEKVFTGTNDFEAFYKAEAWLRENGYFTGSTEREAPIGIAKKDWVSSYKWRHLSQHGKNELDGIICAGSKRNGAVAVIIFDSENAKEAYI